MEVWKDIEGYEGLYQVSSLGRVKSFHKYSNGIVLKEKTDIQGYRQVSLINMKKSRTFYVHRLVAQAFIPNPENKETVNHKDEDKSNNSIDNLEWMTMKENANYGTRNDRCGNKGKAIFQIKNGFVINKWSSIREASKNLGVNPSSIGYALKHKQDKFLGYLWRYVYTR